MTVHGAFSAPICEICAICVLLFRRRDRSYRAVRRRDDAWACSTPRQTFRTTSGELRRATIPAVFTAVANILASIAAVLQTITHIFAAITHVLAPVAYVLQPIAAATVVQRIAAVLAAITNILRAIATVLDPIPDVLAAVTDIFPAVAYVLSAVTADGNVPVELGMQRTCAAGLSVLSERQWRGTSEQGRGDRSHSEFAHRTPRGRVTRSPSWRALPIRRPPTRTR